MPRSTSTPPFTGGGERSGVATAALREPRGDDPNQTVLCPSTPTPRNRLAPASQEARRVAAVGVGWGRHRTPDDGCQRDGPGRSGREGVDTHRHADGRVPLSGVDLCSRCDGTSVMRLRRPTAALLRVAIGRGCSDACSGTRVGDVLLIVVDGHFGSSPIVGRYGRPVEPVRHGRRRDPLAARAC